MSKFTTAPIVFVLEEKIDKLERKLELAMEALELCDGIFKNGSWEIRCECGETKQKIKEIDNE
jgi:hypothetical protein